MTTSSRPRSKRSISFSLAIHGVDLTSALVLVNALYLDHQLGSPFVTGAVIHGRAHAAASPKVAGILL